MIIEKKVWPEFFQKILDGKKNAEIRLADFDLKKGDSLVLREYSPDIKEYTGRKITKKIKNLNRVDLTHMYDLKRIQEQGVYLIEFE